MDDPKTLEELQRDANSPKKGYHIHHIVEQTPARQDGFPCLLNHLAREQGQDFLNVDPPGDNELVQHQSPRVWL